MLDPSIVSAGIDYISATLPIDAINAASWWHSCTKYLETIVSAGNELSPLRRLGYDGVGVGGCFLGMREDTYLCTISGERAQAGFDAVYADNVHVSRLDYQVTVSIPGGARNTAQLARNAVIQSNKRLGSERQRNATLIEDLKGGATCYVGSMKGPQYARIYNKDAESGEDKYKDCWRYEVVLRNALATKMAKQFAISEYAQPNHAAVSVRQWLAKRGISVPWKAEAELYALPTITTPISDEEKRLTWLREQVRPAIRRLLKLGLYDSVIEALGLDTWPRG